MFYFLHLIFIMYLWAYQIMNLIIVYKNILPK